MEKQQEDAVYLHLFAFGAASGSEKNPTCWFKVLKGKKIILKQRVHTVFNVCV